MAGKGLSLARYRRPFVVQGIPCEVVIWSRFTGLFSELRVAGRTVAEDHTPPTGPEAIRNHRLQGLLPDGTAFDVEAGYVSWWNVGIAVRQEGRLAHESHPGRRIAMPESAAKMARDPGVDMTRYQKNKIPIMVDIGLGLLFYVVAKFTDLSTAAIVGATAGIALVVAQRFVKVDLVGGLALFGVFILLVSAGLAIAFQDDMAVKMRTTIVGLISATLFIGDGLLGGNRLGKGLARYLPYRDIDPGRLALGLGFIGLLMAGLNYVVANLASTDVWLFYTTFVDFLLVMGLLLLVFRYARHKPLFDFRNDSPPAEAGATGSGGPSEPGPR
jgi:intracellular septation protein A